MEPTEEEVALEMDGPLPADLVTWWRDWLPKMSGIRDLFASPLFPLQRRAEMLRMISLASEVNPKTVVEIGADKGGGVWAWCRSLPTIEHCVVCEIRGTPYVPLLQEAFPRVKFYEAPCSSRHPLALEKARAVAPIDVLFIDGDKSFFDADFYAYESMMAKGGIVFMHDVQDAVTGEAFKKCRTGRQWARLVDTSESVAALVNGRKRVVATSDHENWLRHWRGDSCGVGVIWL